MSASTETVFIEALSLPTSERAALAEKLLAKDPISLALTKTTCNALAESMVPAHTTHSDREYLMLSSLLARQRTTE